MDNKFVRILLILVTMVIVGYASFVVYSKVTEFSDDSKTQEEILKEGIELTDGTIKNDISSKISLILSNGHKNDSSDIGWTYQLYEDFTFDKKEKADIALNAILDTSHTLSLEDVESFRGLLGKQYPPETDINYFVDNSEYTIVNGSTLEAKYKELFNEHFEHSDISGCPFAYYNSDNNKYFLSSECGGGYWLTLYYKNKYVQKEDEIDVYVSIATYDELETLSIYKGLKNTDLLYQKDIIYNEETLNYEVEDEIKENYQKYAQYKFKFAKNSNGLYSFKSVEAID